MGQTIIHPQPRPHPQPRRRATHLELPQRPRRDEDGMIRCRLRLELYTPLVKGSDGQWEKGSGLYHAVRGGALVFRVPSKDRLVEALGHLKRFLGGLGRGTNQ